MAKLIKNVLLTKVLQILAAVLTLCLFTNPQARAQYPGGSYYAPTQQPQQPGTATPQTGYPQSYQQPTQPTSQQPAQPSVQPVQPAQSSYQQSGYQTSTTLDADDDDEKPESKKGKSDHEKAVGQVGLALLGIMNMPIPIHTCSTTLFFNMRLRPALYPELCIWHYATPFFPAT